MVLFQKIIFGEKLNKIIKILMIFIIAASFTVSSVVASELVKHDFDGKFEALTYDDADIDNQTVDNTITFIDKKNEIVYSYTPVDELNDDNIDYFYQGLEDSGEFERVGTDGNLTIFKVNNEDYGDNAVGIYSEGEVLIIIGDDLNELKEIGKSIKF